MPGHFLNDVNKGDTKTETVGGTHRGNLPVRKDVGTSNTVPRGKADLRCFCDERRGDKKDVG